MNLSHTLDLIWGAHGQTRLAERCEVDSRTVRRWITDQSEPRYVWFLLDRIIDERVIELQNLQKNIQKSLETKKL